MLGCPLAALLQLPPPSSPESGGAPSKSMSACVSFTSCVSSGRRCNMSPLNTEHQASPPHGRRPPKSNI